MANKESKLQQINKASIGGAKPVFSQGMFAGPLGANNVKVNTDDYTYINTEIGSINYSETTDYPDFLYESIKSSRLVNPIILSYEYNIAERGGRQFREKTGRYNIVDGLKRVSIYNRLFNEAMANNDEKLIAKYSTIQSLVLPINSTDEEIEKIKKAAANDKTSGATNMIKDITETKNQEITYCYRYETSEINREDIIERDNTFKITQTEIDELEKSIYHAGLMQPLVLLPVIDAKTMQVKYEIQAGHKRNKAINQLVKHAEEGLYPNSDFIINSFKTIPSLLAPMGATKEQVEKIYNDTNILSRHMTTEDVFEHINYFDDLPTRPATKKDYVEFKEKKYKMDKLANQLQMKFKSLGFSDWQNRKTKIFLNVYYYGSDKCLNIFSKLDDYNLTQKELEWIATSHKDFNERKKQDEIIEKALNDKTYLLQLMDKKTIKKTPQKIKIRKLSENLIKEKSALEKYSITPIDLKNASMNDISNAIKIVKELEKALKDVKDRLTDINENDFDK